MSGGYLISIAYYLSFIVLVNGLAQNIVENISIIYNS